MPGPLCNKCRETPSSEGDSWCLGCIAWEALGRELAGHWDVQGARVLANDLVVSCVRQVRSLRSLSAGIHRQADKAVGAGSGRAPTGESRLRGQPEHSEGAERPELPRRPPLPAPVRAPAPARAAPKEEEASGDDGEDEEEEEEESEDPPFEGAVPKKKPPRPDSPDRDRRSSHRAGRDCGSHRESRKERREEDHHQSRGHSSKKRKRKGSHRGGSKHQRLGRLAADPNIRVHRKANPAFLDLGSTRGRDALDRL